MIVPSQILLTVIVIFYYHIEEKIDELEREN